MVWAGSGLCRRAFGFFFRFGATVDRSPGWGVDTNSETPAILYYPDGYGGDVTGLTVEGRPAIFSWSGANTSRNMPAAYASPGHARWCLTGIDRLGYTPLDAELVLCYTIAGAGTIDVRVQDTTAAATVAEVTGLTAATGAVASAVYSCTWPATAANAIQIQVQSTVTAADTTLLIHGLHLAARRA